MSLCWLTIGAEASTAGFPWTFGAPRNSLRAEALSYRLLGLAFLLFDLFPVAEDVGGGLGGGGAEDVGMAANHFRVDFADDVGDGEAFFFVSDLSVEEDLKEEIAEFLGELGVVSRVESVKDFVGFFDEIGAKSGVGLLAIPGATAGRAQASHDGDKLFKIAADVRRGLRFRIGPARLGRFTRLGGLAPGFARWHGSIRREWRDDSLYGGRRDLTSEVDA